MLCLKSCQKCGVATRIRLSEFRASQMNLVLHFGRTVSPEEAKERFEIAVRFANGTQVVLLFYALFLKIISRCRRNYLANVSLEILIGNVLLEV